MLQVNHIHLVYGPRVVLDDVSCTIAPGEKAGLIGVNGAGKSSLVKIIAGILDPIVELLSFHVRMGTSRKRWRTKLP